VIGRQQSCKPLFRLWMASTIQEMHSTVRSSPTQATATAPPPSGLRQRLFACALQAARVPEEERLTREAEATRRAAAFRAAAVAHAERVDVRAWRDFDGANQRRCGCRCTASTAPAPAIPPPSAVLEFDAAGRRVRLRRLTPHRVDGCAVGEFRSRHTFADKCQRCETPIYPFPAAARPPRRRRRRRAPARSRAVRHVPAARPPLHPRAARRPA
jgi:hypothetical protein